MRQLWWDSVWKINLFVSKSLKNFLDLTVFSHLDVSFSLHLILSQWLFGGNIFDPTVRPHLEHHLTNQISLPILKHLKSCWNLPALNICGTSMKVRHLFCGEVGIFRNPESVRTLVDFFKVAEGISLPVILEIRL